MLKKQQLFCKRGDSLMFIQHNEISWINTKLSRFINKKSPFTIGLSSWPFSCIICFSTTHYVIYYLCKWNMWLQYSWKRFNFFIFLSIIHINKSITKKYKDSISYIETSRILFTVSISHMCWCFGAARNNRMSSSNRNHIIFDI